MSPEQNYQQLTSNLASTFVMQEIPEPTNRENALRQMRPQYSFMEGMLRGGRNETTAAMQTNIAFLRAKLANSPLPVSQAVKIDAGVMHGNPVFRGTRIPLYRILEELADGTSLEELPDAYEPLTLDQIVAGLDFAVRLLRVYDD
jgi:uncharacterized protein (DUF433 family)